MTNLKDIDTALQQPVGLAQSGPASRLNGRARLVLSVAICAALATGAHGAECDTDKTESLAEVSLETSDTKSLWLYETTTPTKDGTAGVTYLTADFYGLMLPSAFEGGTSAYTGVDYSRNGHLEGVVFEKALTGYKATAIVDFFADATSAQSDFLTRSDPMMTDVNFVSYEDAWISTEDPTTTVRCWHAPIDAVNPSDAIECVSWTDTQTYTLATRIIGIGLADVETAEDLLQESNDMLRAAWHATDGLPAPDTSLRTASLSSVCFVD